ncbi:MAG: hypothetical protein QOC86_3178, partial [Gaiellales bacterium]|nr:hypothetical protein [Gaiellales bacterium]
CIPSKTLLRPGEALQQAREAPGAAEAVDGKIVDAQAAFAWRDFQTSNYDDAGQVSWLESEGIDLLRGHGRITAAGTVAVGERTVTATHIVVATGSDPVIPPIDGLRELDGVWTNREVTGLKEVPRRLLVLGAGPVGVEMALAVRRLGAEVALVEGAEHVLSREPAPLGEALGKALESEGVELHLGVHATSARRDGADYVLMLDDGEELRGDRLLVATGRSPRVDGIGLENAGVTFDKHGIEIDGRCSAAENVWAIGDVTGIWPLTYVGKYQGRVVAANILGRPREANYDAVPRSVFTDPQAAAVGVAEDRLSATVQMKAVARTATYTRDYEDRPGFLTVLSDGEVVTGAYALGPDAGEWLQQATLAIRARVPLAVYEDTIQPFPTFSEAFLDVLTELGEKAAAARV